MKALLRLFFAVFLLCSGTFAALVSSASEETASLASTLTSPSKESEITDVRPAEKSSTKTKITDLQAELIDAIQLLGGPIVSLRLRTANRHFNKMIGALTPIEQVLAACQTDRFLLCVREIEELHKSLLMAAFEQAAQKAITMATLALVMVYDANQVDYLKFIELYLKAKGNNLAVLDQLVRGVKTEDRDRALLLAAKYGNQYMVYCWEYLASQENWNLTFEETITGHQETILEYLYRQAQVHNRPLSIPKNHDQWLQDFLQRQDSPRIDETVETAFATCKTGDYLECRQSTLGLDISQKKALYHKAVWGLNAIATKVLKDLNNQPELVDIYWNQKQFPGVIKSCLRGNDQDIDMLYTLLTAGFDTEGRTLSVASNLGNQFTVFFLTKSQMGRIEDVVLKAYFNAITMQHADIVKYYIRLKLPTNARHLQARGFNLDRDSRLWLDKLSAEMAPHNPL